MKNFIKVIGLVATIGGIAANLVSDWADEKTMDEKIDQKVSEALSKEKGESLTRALFFSRKIHTVL